MLNQQQIKNQFESLATLQAIQKQAYQMLVQGLATTGFSMREWEILVYLEQHGQATASELADAFMVTRTLISRNTWRLIQDDLIQSQVNQTDRRIVRLTLTINGQETVQKSVRQVQENLKTFNQSHDLEKLTKQVETLSQQLAKIN
ncbi:MULTISPECIES: MarR family winged helix-turn-helix transcriptional regulator [Lactobacillaceae]|jgi:DNA-binding MarR family transcriptional regulator|uniref:MarR family winged helix-turn-helix transcriptional regulator n=1 Tax=Lactobacillaceae TaxID=33958 RepID=UPI0006C6FF5B|nr:MULTISPECIES: MarR family transcriptional regulator [Lactobacillaceae]KON39704.1 MarR family transcriptional regulator [Lactiplantibacillus plantarum]MBQ0838080.1 MarR family transcriptional regulator [Lactiplantibacillus pentosus]MBU7462763.1 MarR family transcriptional regulator [Lactiplantibacillus pentosus]MBU7478756.1 MarR family transcriptional regulator [Lactiplantibacillus pentosus]MBU7485411.1 MarR family transcriptional regulator [Lactiplantibacillus sp. 30.2.29]